MELIRSLANDASQVIGYSLPLSTPFE